MIRIPIDVRNTNTAIPTRVKVSSSKVAESDASLTKFNSVFPDKIIPIGNQPNAAIIETIEAIRMSFDSCSI